MKSKLLLSTLGCLISGVVFAQKPVATCIKPSGYMFYPEVYPVTSNNAGWKKDGISNGKFALVQNSLKEYDVLFIDASGRTVTSAVQDGAQTVLLRKSYKEIVFLVNYSEVTELYSFWKADNGNYRFALSQSKRGTITKYGTMIGSCSEINFDIMK